MSMRDFTTIDGSCHCKNIRFAFRWPDSEPDIPVRRCGCTFCQKHGGAWTSHRDSDLTIAIDSESLVSKYRFGTKTADFVICSVCGVTPLVLCEIDGTLYSVVNVNTFEDADRISFSSSVTDFDGEDTGGRLERRKRNWIPQVILKNNKDR